MKFLIGLSVLCTSSWWSGLVSAKEIKVPESKWPIDRVLASVDTQNRGLSSLDCI